MRDDCDKVLERLERYLDGECPREIEGLVRAHLQDCSPCLSRADFQQALRELIASKCRETAPSGLLQRVMARLEASHRR